MFLAFVILAVIVPAFIAPKKFRVAFEEYMNNTALVRVSALFILFLAFIILNTRWTVKLNSNRSIMAVIGYLTLAKGLFYLWFPGTVKKMAHKIFVNENLFFALMTVALIFALFIGYLGIWVY